MPGHILIDGNNLLHAMHAHAPVPPVGRETLAKIVERWAAGRDDDVTLVFDGPVPPAGLAKQMTSGRITVRFSAPATADDVIVAMIHRQSHPERVRVVSSDTAIRHEATARRCQPVDAAEFVAELFASPHHIRTPSVPETTGKPPAQMDKPPAPTPEQTDEWLGVFGMADEEDGRTDANDITFE